MIAEATAFLTRGIFSARTQAALLNFNFTTEGGETVSFTLDTSISLRKGFYPNAVSELKVNGLSIPARFDLGSWDESGLTFWGVNWCSGGIYLGFAKASTERLSPLEAYRSFTPMPESYLWGKRNNCFRKDEYITKLKVKHYDTTQSGLWHHWRGTSPSNRLTLPKVWLV